MWLSLNEGDKPLGEYGDVPHEIIQCRRHLRLFINGKLVVTLPATMQETAGRAFMNTTSDIRRACKDYRATVH